jgi:hypothetical protein
MTHAGKGPRTAIDWNDDADAWPPADSASDIDDTLLGELAATPHPLLAASAAGAEALPCEQIGKLRSTAAAASVR